MMSILIPGMEMPTSCEKCPFLDYEEGFCFASGVKVKSGWYESTLCPGGIKGGRHDDCPLIHVPEHGDLIDRDATMGKIGHLADEIDKKLGYEKSAPYIMMTLYLNNADEFPTIIPAEEGEG